MNRLLPVFAVFVAIALYFLYIQPTYNTTIADDQAKITSYNNALAAAKAFSAKQDQLVASRNQIANDNINRLQAFLPDSVDNVQLILDLNSLAAKSGISLSNFLISNDSTNSKNQVSAPATPAGAQPSGAQPTPMTAAPGALGNAATPAMLGGPSLARANSTNSLTITVTAKGTYAAFRTFLQAAEDSLRPLDITEVNLKNSANGIYTYTITFRIYWLTS